MFRFSITKPLIFDLLFFFTLIVLLVVLFTRVPLVQHSAELTSKISITPSPDSAIGWLLQKKSIEERDRTTKEMREMGIFKSHLMKKENFEKFYERIRTNSALKNALLEAKKHGINIVAGAQTFIDLDTCCIYINVQAADGKIIEFLVGGDAKTKSLLERT